MDVKSELNESVENLDLNGSGWVYDLIAGVTIDLHKDVIKSGSS